MLYICWLQNFVRLQILLLHHLSGDWGIYSTNGMCTSRFTPTLDAYDQTKDHCLYQTESSWSIFYRCVYQTKLSCLVCSINARSEPKATRLPGILETLTNNWRKTNHITLDLYLTWQYRIRQLNSMHFRNRRAAACLDPVNNLLYSFIPFLIFFYFFFEFKVCSTELRSGQTKPTPLAARQQGLPGKTIFLFRLAT